jgi:hypothetical protein
LGKIGKIQLLVQPKFIPVGNVLSGCCCHRRVGGGRSGFQEQCRSCAWCQLYSFKSACCRLSKPRIINTISIKITICSKFYHIVHCCIVHIICCLQYIWQFVPSTDCCIVHIIHCLQYVRHRQLVASAERALTAVIYFMGRVFFSALFVLSNTQRRIALCYLLAILEGWSDEQHCFHIAWLDGLSQGDSNHYRNMDDLKNVLDRPPYHAPYHLGASFATVVQCCGV